MRVSSDSVKPSVRLIWSKNSKPRKVGLSKVEFRGAVTWHKHRQTHKQTHL